MNSLIRSRSVRGFSLIEVMIAVVVLSIGLLALAALQANLIRSSAESKAQTVALSLAKDRIEDLRTYTDINDYRTLTDGNDDADDNGGLGGVDYDRSWTVERFAFDGAAFVQLADTGAAPTSYPTNNEFKRIRVNVRWTDANGVGQIVAMEDAIGAIDPRDSARLARVSRTATPRPAEMIIVNPASVPGVIPIAIGGGTDTAATNPRPEVAGRNNNQRVVETRFDIFTYAALSGTNALAQSRVETSVVGCRCDLGQGGGNVPRGKRPTYWDGERYVVPEDATYNAPAGHAVLGNNDPPDSRLCDICCRDHHDPDPTITTPKFDPRRSSHDHYVAGGMTPVNSGVYQDACRIIRVDGIFRVAADMYNDKFGLLATADLAGIPAKLPVPSDGATSGYQAFVLDYLRNRVTLAANTAYNTRTPIVPYADATNDPTSIDIDAVADFKWLHGRGLYMDYLETDAITRIDQAKTACATRTPTPCSASETHTAVLKLLPFTTINLSELANWTPATGDDIVVTNNDFLASLTNSDPVRGKVLPGGNPTPNATPRAISSIFESNSGVALLLDATDPQEDGAPLTDGQDFRVVGSSSNTGGSFTVTFANNYPFTNSTAALPTITAVPSATCSYATTGGSKPNPYSCTSQNLAGATELTIGRYNYEDPRRRDATFTCTGGSGTLLRPLNNQNVNVCRNYRISAATPGGIVTDPVAPPLGNEGLVGETTVISFTTLTNGTAVSLNMVEETPETISYTCTYTGDGAGNNDYTVSPKACP